VKSLGLGRLALLSLLLGVAACHRGGEANEAQSQNVAAQPVQKAAPAVPLPQPPMDRAALLELVAKARSAAAAGADDRESQRTLDGKEFEFRIRFGCGGPSSKAKDKAPFGWSFDPKSGVLRVHAAPTLSSDDPVIAALGIEDVEDVEGFWLPRPWLLQATCPAVPPPAGEQQPESESVQATASHPVPSPLPAVLKMGIAQFFTVSDPRTGRRDERPYEAVKKLDPGASVGVQGFDLVLAGRLRALPDGRVIHCNTNGPDAPPDCIAAALFDHVWIEDAATKLRIADWGSS
jgi:hypothetical protein